MVDMIRTFEETGAAAYETSEEAEMARLTHGSVCFEPTAKEMNSRNVRPSLWVVKDMAVGDKFIFGAENKEQGNFDSIRPGGGLHIRFSDVIEGRVAPRDIKAGTPLCWEHIYSDEDGP